MTTDPGQPTDAAVILWIRERIESTNEFVWIGVGKSPRGRTASASPGAWVYPVGFAESDDSDDYAITRTLRYAIVVAVREPEELEALSRLDRLSNVVADALADGPPGGVPGLCRIDSGRYETAAGSGTGHIDGQTGNAGENVLILYGSAAYLIEGRAGRND